VALAVAPPLGTARPGGRRASRTGRVAGRLPRSPRRGAALHRPANDRPASIGGSPGPPPIGGQFRQIGTGTNGGTARGPRGQWRPGPTRQIVSGTDWRDCPRRARNHRPSIGESHRGCRRRRAVPQIKNQHRIAGVYWRIAPGPPPIDGRFRQVGWHQMAERGPRGPVAAGTKRARSCPAPIGAIARSPPRSPRRGSANDRPASIGGSQESINGQTRQIVSGTDWRAPIGGTAPYFERRSTACLTSSSGSGPPSSRYWR
jgi:hypothetical protein